MSWTPPSHRAAVTENSFSPKDAMKESTIEWTTHTFNAWIGCSKVSAGCLHCYAETLMDLRYGRVQWGPGNPRSRTTPAYWRQPLQWNAEAAQLKHRPRVFCASLSDVFDEEVPSAWRDDLWDLIKKTPHLDWLLLTKRPDFMLVETQRLALPSNVWLGLSVEDQRNAEERIPKLLAADASVRFLSAEPLLGPLNLSRWISNESPSGIHWVIAGGESGAKARPMAEEWVQDIRSVCEAADVAFLFKQWGGSNKKSAGRTLNGRTYDEFPSPVDAVSR